MAAAEQSQKPQISIARNDADKEALYRFRYDIVVREMQQDPVEADHKAKILYDPLDDTGIHLYMTVGGKVIAAVRLNLGKLTQIPDDLREAYALDKFSAFPVEQLALTSQPVVEEKFRAGHTPAVLLGAAYKLTRQQNVRFDFCHCPPYLVPLYEQLGYRQYTGNFIDKNSGYNLPMVLLTEDIDYLREVHSPLVKLAAQHKNNPKTAHWFQQTFADQANAPRKKMSEDEFWRMLTKKLHQIPLVSIPLLSDLTFDEAKKFLRAATVIEAKKGDEIVRAGEVGNEMFVMLTGAVEVRMADQAGHDHVLCVLGQGDVFGEVGFLTESPRTAQVVAISDTEVLMLTQSFFQKVMSSMPKITSRVLFNLSLILCERLRLSNAHWMAALAGEDDSEVRP